MSHIIKSFSLGVRTIMSSNWAMGRSLLYRWCERFTHRRHFEQFPDVKPQSVWPWVVVLLITTLIWAGIRHHSELEISYGEFLLLAEKGELSDLRIFTDHIIGSFGIQKKTSFITYPLPDVALARLLASKGVAFSVESGSIREGMSYLFFLLPTLLLFVFFLISLGRFGSLGSGIFRPVRRSLPIVLDSSNRMRFKDVAGTHEAKQELEETISFLKDPRQIERLGGRMPKGVLLIGAPGTGKTLLARAVAGEAGVPFFNISGSEFIEMFVGVGAARVRELFEQAREYAPCMIFIDELDAIGRARGGTQMLGGHDEREQTLNQLLTEMDGFDPSLGVVVMAATNRPEILDRALLRAGRFDRQIVIDRPNLEERLEILTLHAQHLVIDPQINLRVVAQRSAGLVGADLANICNEAAILAVRDHADHITMRHFESAIDRVLAGPEKKSIVLSLDEKERVACHEAGHALVSALLPNAQPVQKVSIIPRGAGVLGYTLQLPVEERFISTESELQVQLSVLMAGRKAEFLKFGNYSNGAKNDLELASMLARKMICEWGMSPKLGPVTLGHGLRLKYLEVQEAEQQNYSDQTARCIDQEIKTLLLNAEDSAGKLLELNRPLLDEITRLLIKEEVLEGQRITRMASKEARSLEA